MSRFGFFSLFSMVLLMPSACGGSEVPLAYESNIVQPSGGQAPAGGGGGGTVDLAGAPDGGAAGASAVCEKGDKPSCSTCATRLVCNAACAPAVDCEAADREVRSCVSGFVRCYGKPEDWSPSSCPPCWLNNL